MLFANVDFRGVGTPGWSEQAAAQLEADIKAGAKGLKIFKDLGLRIRKADGSAPSRGRSGAGCNLGSGGPARRAGV